MSRIRCRPVAGGAELAAHHAIRHAVFVTEQGVFAGSDRDRHDDEAIHLIGLYDGVPAGSVRLFELDPGAGRWQGDRLAVLPDYRVAGLGGPLVGAAVATAALHGGHEMVAHVQLPNVCFFTRLGWTSIGAIETYAGLPHQQMLIGLPTVPRARELLGALAGGATLAPVSGTSP